MTLRLAPRTAPRFSSSVRADATIAEELRDALGGRGAYALPAPYDKLAVDRPRFDLIAALISTEVDALQLMMGLGQHTTERIVFVVLNADLLARFEGRKHALILNGTTEGGMQTVAEQLVGRWARPEWPAHDSAGFRTLASLAGEAQDAIEEILSALGARWEKEPAIGPDYLVQLPDDRRIVIEVKARAPRRRRITEPTDCGPFYDPSRHASSGGPCKMGPQSVGWQHRTADPRGESLR